MEALKSNIEEDQVSHETDESCLTQEQKEVIEFMRICDESVLSLINGDFLLP